MGRVAGENSHYTFNLVDYQGKKVKGAEVHLPSVTYILGTVLGAGDALLDWYYSKGLEGVSALANHFGDEFTPVAQLVEELREELNKQKLSPYHRKHERAAEGTAAHAYFEKLAQDYTAGDDFTTATGFEFAIASWWALTKPQVEQAERVMWSLRHGFAGTVDLVWWDSDGLLNITDLKTRKVGSDQAYEKDLLQVDAYDLANEEMTGMRASKTGILIARDDGTYVYDQRRVPRGSFLKVLEVYRTLQEVA